MTPEKKLMNEIRLYCGTKGWIVIRNNVGTFKLANGTYLNTGLPKGWPDLTILIPGGHSVFVETKIKKNKVSNDQKEKITLLRKYQFKSFVCRSIEEFIQEMSEFI